MIEWKQMTMQEAKNKMEEYIKDECEDAKKYGKMAEMAEEINDDELYSIVTAIAKDEKQIKMRGMDIL